MTESVSSVSPSSVLGILSVSIGPAKSSLPSTPPFISSTHLAAPSPSSPSSVTSLPSQTSPPSPPSLPGETPVGSNSPASAPSSVVASTTVSLPRSSSSKTVPLTTSISTIPFTSVTRPILSTISVTSVTRFSPSAIQVTSITRSVLSTTVHTTSVPSTTQFLSPSPLPIAPLRIPGDASAPRGSPSMAQQQQKPTPVSAKRGANPSDPDAKSGSTTSGPPSKNTPGSNPPAAPLSLPVSVSKSSSEPSPPPLKPASTPDTKPSQSSHPTTPSSPSHSASAPPAKPPSSSPTKSASQSLSGPSSPAASPPAAPSGTSDSAPAVPRPSPSPVEPPLPSPVEPPPSSALPAPPASSPAAVSHALDLVSAGAPHSPSKHPFVPAAPSSDPQLSLSAAPSSSPAPVVNSPKDSSEAGSTPPASTTHSFTRAAGRIQGPDSDGTSTVTIHPESTFATPMSIPVTVSGHTTLSAPPFITSLAISTLPDGASVTVTHIIANPTDGLTAVRGHSFFNNHGAVIGVFLVTGIAVACLSVLSFCLLRRRRRRINGDQLRDRSPTLPANPFSDPMEQTMYEHGPSSIHWDRQRFVRDDDPNRSLVSMPEPAHISSSSHVALNLTGVGSGGRSQGLSNFEGPFSSYNRSHQRVAISLVDQAFAAQVEEQSRSHSRAQSTPSIYPPSLPEENADSLYEKELQESHPPLAPKLSPPPSPAPRLQMPVPPPFIPPPRDPFADGPNFRRAPPNLLVLPKSPLRPQSRHLESEPSPLTPTNSSSSHTQSDPFGSPVSETGTALTPILDEKVYHSLPILPDIPPEAFLRRSYSRRAPLNRSGGEASEAHAR